MPPLSGALAPRSTPAPHRATGAAVAAPGARPHRVAAVLPAAAPRLPPPTPPDAHRRPLSRVTDLALSRRLERAEASASAAFVEARAATAPGTEAGWREVAGTYAMFDGAGSPITQTFGLGLFAPAADADLAELEGFFETRGADTHHEVSPLADPALLACCRPAATARWS
jgi:hypothetical protein